eukprot:TRINITY_DN118_c0_g2_i8.p2 TRINITY_DN118_c0_g2~~TRINITY_DN118_c0_g2_i8.p2  ORF type:complete len:352 (+),score=139.95 TRINITY_DN118_c0_g2_i8:97-1152(+)
MLDSLYGRKDVPSKLKRHYRLNRPVMSNPDVQAILHSETVRRVLKPPRKPARRVPRCNPLRSFAHMARLNPAIVDLRIKQVKKDRELHHRRVQRRRLAKYLHLRKVAKDEKKPLPKPPFKLHTLPIRGVGLTGPETKELLKKLTPEQLAKRKEDKKKRKEIKKAGKKKIRAMADFQGPPKLPKHEVLSREKLEAYDQAWRQALEAKKASVAEQLKPREKKAAAPKTPEEEAKKAAKKKAKDKAWDKITKKRVQKFNATHSKRRQHETFNLKHAKERKHFEQWLLETKPKKKQWYQPKGDAKKKDAKKGKEPKAKEPKEPKKAKEPKEPKKAKEPKGKEPKQEAQMPATHST